MPRSDQAQCGSPGVPEEVDTKSKAIATTLSLVALIIMAGSPCRARSGWSVVPTGFDTGIQSLFCIDQDTLCACGRSGLVAKTTDGGESWSTTVFDTVTSLSCIWLTEHATGYVCGQNLQTARAQLFKTTDGRSTWSFVKEGGSNTAYSALCFTDSANGYVAMMVGTNGSILRTTNAGQTWATYGGIAYVCAFHSIDAALGIVVGQRRVVYKTTDAGGRWRSTLQLPDAPLYDFHSVFFADSAAVFASGDNGSLYRSTDVGYSWASTYGNTSLMQRLASLWFTDSITGYVVVRTVSSRRPRMQA